jgi:hypothetical protein
MSYSLSEKVTPHKVLAVLQASHMGREHGVNITALTRAVVKTAPTPGQERSVRFAISVLRDSGHPICAHPNDGYFYAKNDAEVSETCEFLFSRAMHSLKQIASLKRKAMPELRGQLGLEIAGG